MPDTPSTLSAQVRQTLLSAGYDFNTTAPTAPGLYIRAHDDAVILTWNPAPHLMIPSLLHAAHDTTTMPGMHDAVRKALLTVLTAAGFTLADDPDPNKVRITGSRAPTAP